MNQCIIACKEYPPKYAYFFYLLNMLWFLPDRYNFAGPDPIHPVSGKISILYVFLDLPYVKNSSENPIFSRESSLEENSTIFMIIEC